MKAADLFRGKRKWFWLALAIPVVIVSLPFLVICIFVGSRLLSMLIGPVNIWNSTKKPPSPQALAGFYQVARDQYFRDQASHLFISETSGLRLEPDHRIGVIDLPAFDDFGKPLDCHFNGTGTWSLYAESTGTQLNVYLAKPQSARPGNLRSCTAQHFALIELLGHSAPFTLWYNIGDPDNNDGLTYHSVP